ncbi:MAG TPA: histidinol dehydrogenase [Chitinophagaceae bacterium]|nr:histidinol dehydrogenase [Chitinophagaceae bacterium]
MKIVLNPEKKDWAELLKRPYSDNTAILELVTEIIATVKEKGDAALHEYSKKFTGASLVSFQVTVNELNTAADLVPKSLKAAIQQAKTNIETFHKAQFSPVEVIETSPGISCWRKGIPIEKIGLYIPGGTAPLFSTVLMLAVPAQLAGCKEIVLCTPANENGEVHPAILFTAQLCGVQQIFKLGGAQAIAAMAFGSETVPQVYKIFGPGNQYVTAAKQIVQTHGIAIDMPAGPSEVCVLCDETAVPEFVAADLLSQAEHGTDSQVLLVSTNKAIVEKVLTQLQAQMEKLPRKEIATAAVQNSKAIVIDDINVAIELVNEYAAEHLILSCENAEVVAEEITNAGSVFIGNYSPETVGDYASGTNHTLPTNGYAKAFSGVSVDSYLKKITYQKLSQEGLRNISKTVVAMAEAEGLQAHANAVRVRVTSLSENESTQEAITHGN